MQGFLTKVGDYWRLSAVLVLIFIVAIWRYSVITESLLVPTELPKEFSGVVVSDPDVRSDGVFLTVKSPSVSPKILVKTARYPEWQYGDEVKVKGQLKLPEAFDTDTGRIFDYPKYLAARGIGLTVSFAEVELIERHNSFWSYLYKIKHAFISAVNRAINEPMAALANGITVGEKQALPKEIKDAFQVTSLSHIIVLSGYNINIVGNLLAHFGAAVGIGGIILFGLMVGGGASIWRAVIMAIIALIGRRFGRTYDALRALIVTALVMSAYNPLWPLYDVGFQLSFLATAGVLVGAPWWEKKLGRVPEKFGLRETLAVTLGAQMAVLPLLLFTSGIISFVALPANVLVVPLVPFAMLVVAIVGLVGMVWSVPALLLGYPTGLLLWLMLKIPEWLAVLPGAYFVLPPFSGWVVVGIYLTILIYLGRRLIFSSDAKISY